MALKYSILILMLAFFQQKSSAQVKKTGYAFDFCGMVVELPFTDTAALPRFKEDIAPEDAASFLQDLTSKGPESILQTLLQYKKSLRLDDWLYYQLIRKTAQLLSPKAANYYEYTFYKWYFLTGSGYDAMFTLRKDSLLFYVQCDENIYNVPAKMQNGKQYVCLNYHDYGSNIDFTKSAFTPITLPSARATQSFSYKVASLPDFGQTDYIEKELRFSYQETSYHFRVKLNKQVKNLFTNYPAVDYESCFNIPLSKETYASLIPLLKKQLKGWSVRKGIDYLLHFTRYAFLFAPDNAVFGAEKRFSPEQTLLFEQSDCEDRSALFFCLIKEIYDLPMIVLSYPQHVTVAVKLDKPVGTPILYKGLVYSICEPTPQKEDLEIGQLLPQLKGVSYEIAYSYMPVRN